jgi:moderate conductance mechanosensitive channel
MTALLNKLGLHIPAELEKIVDAAWHALLVLLLAWLAWRLCVRLIGLGHRRMAARSAGADEVKRIDTMTQVTRYAAAVVIVVVSGMLVLDQVGISIAPFIATAGVAGIAVGFGVQSLLKDYFTGIVLLLEDQIRKGDTIEAAGRTGTVEQMTLRYVRLRDYGGNVHFIPNGLISTVTNQSREFAYAVIDAGIAYGADIDRALVIMREVATRMRTDDAYAPRIRGDLEVAGVERWDNSAIVLRARLKVAPDRQDGVRREFLRRLKYAFDGAGIEIPYPHLTVYAGTREARASFAVQVIEPDGR